MAMNIGPNFVEVQQYACHSDVHFGASEGYLILRSLRHDGTKF